MLLDENLKASGKLRITKIKSDGTKEISLHKNLVVDVGLAYIAQRMVNAGGVTGENSGHLFPAQMSHMGIGEGTAAPIAGNTALGTTTTLGRQPLTTAAVNVDNITYEATFNPGQGTGALVEAGIFNGATGGVMLCRTQFPIVTKSADDTIIIQWTVSIAAA